MFYKEDQVRLQRNLTIGLGANDYVPDGATTEMQTYQNKIVTINSVVEINDASCNVLYEIAEDGGTNTWTPSMIQGIVNKKQNPDTSTYIYVKAEDGSIQKCKVLWTDTKNEVKHYVVDLNESFELLKATELATAQDIATWKENEVILTQIEEMKAVIENATASLNALVSKAQTNGLM